MSADAIPVVGLALTAVGLLLTAISLGLAVYTLRQARDVQEEAERLRNRFLFRQRAPDFLEAIEDMASAINDHVAGKRPLLEQELKATLQRCDARLQSFEDKVEGEYAKNRLRSVRQKAKNALEGADVGRERLHEIYAGLQGLHESVEKLLEDRRREVHP